MEEFQNINPTMELVERAERKPNVAQIGDLNYSAYGGVPHLHPLHLFTELREQSPWIDLATQVIGATCSSAVPTFRIKNNAKQSYKKLWQKRADEVKELLMYPNPHQTCYELFDTTYENLPQYGNSYWQVIKNRDGSVNSLYTLPPESMHAVPWFDQDNILHFSYIQYNIANSNLRVYDEDEIIHFKLPNPKSFVYGKPRYLSLVVQIASNINASKALNAWFEVGMVAGSIFKQDADAEVAKRNREFIKEYFTRPENFGRAMILEGNMELVKDGNKFKDFDYKKLSETERDNILMAAGIPLSIAGVRSDNGSTNAEVIKSEELAYSRNTLEFYQKIVFEKLNQKLLRQIMGWKELEITPGAITKFDMSNAIQTIEAASKFGVKVGTVYEMLGLPEAESEDAMETFILMSNNGAAKVEDIIGINYKTGEKCATLFDKAQEQGVDDETKTTQTSMDGGADKAHGLGGDLADKAEK